MATPQRDPFDVTLNQEQRDKLALWLANEVESALNAKAMQDSEVDYWHMLYEQARTRAAKNLPWPDAADLTSPLGCVYVDALHARMMRTIWTDPVCTVIGYGASADNADYVEEFHQWKAEEERLQSVLDKLFLISLIEPRGLLEVSEGSEWRTVRKRIQAAIEIDPQTGGQVVDEKGNLSYQKNDDGTYVEATDPMQPAAEVLLDSTENQRVGPQYRILPYRDSLIFPGHARDKDEIWGYGKRLWKRHADLKLLSEGPHALYDKEQVDRLTQTGDREPNAALERSGTTVAPQDATTAEKELWEILFLIDLKAFFEQWGITPPRKLKAGARWYVATLHANQQIILRLQYDDLDCGRFVLVNLFPRTDRVTEGFSFIGHKLITTIEEHTAYRNMAADRSSMKNNVPILRMQGALWDPVEQPWGPKAVIDVRDPREIAPVQGIEDVPQSIFEHIQMAERTAERLAGVNDVAAGQVSQSDRTLGEVQMATEQSFVRMDLVVRRAQEPVEDLYQIRHAILKRVLAEKGEDGVDPPQSLIVGIEGRGTPIDEAMPDRKFTAQMLEGSYRFKPHGSVETADKGKLRGDFVQAMQFMPMMLQAFPMLQMQFRGPMAAKAMARQFVRLFNIANPQAFLGSPAQDAMQAPMGMDMGMGLPPGMPPAGGPGMPPGMPPGLPPMGAPPTGEPPQ